MTTKERRLTAALEECLRDQAITPTEPGTVLADFGMLVDFLGPNGVETGGKYNLLPIKFIAELDSRLSRPLNLELTRPQLKSHPYLQGLHLLLRASGLTRVVGVGAKTRLTLDPVLLAQWEQLNPTEQYFNLLEAWLRFGCGEMVGEKGGRRRDDFLFNCEQFWHSLPEKGKGFDSRTPQEVYLSGIDRRFYLLALLDLFGLVKVEQPAHAVSNWSPLRVTHTPFGDAVFTRLLAVPESRFGFLFGLVKVEDEAEDEDQDDEAPEGPHFGAWQSHFQPYFPEWRQNLTFPEPEPRDGVFVFRVSLNKEIWRLIAIPAEDTLDDLLGAILRAFKFDDEHFYEFSYRDHLGATVSAVHPEMDEGPWADTIPLGTLPLEPGQAMALMYDFGDSWRFTVKLERIEPRGTRRKARVIESHGKAPKQYPDWDD